jgi:hypothetical protein
MPSGRDNFRRNRVAPLGDCILPFASTAAKFVPQGIGESIRLKIVPAPERAFECANSDKGKTALAAEASGIADEASGVENPFGAEDDMARVKPCPDEPSN